MKASTSPASMVGGIVLSLCIFAVIGPHLKTLLHERAGCTQPTNGTIVDWVKAENGRRLEGVATFLHQGEARRVTLHELNRNITSPGEVGESVALLVNPSTGAAVLASPIRALGVWVGLLAVGVLILVGCTWVLARPALWK